MTTTWTEAAETVDVGTSTLIVMVDTSSEWKVGDEIVVASTDFNSEHAERKIIEAISSYDSGNKA